MSRLSLRDRVTAATALVLALGLATLTLGMNALLSRQLDNDLSARLRERADAQLATISVRDGRVLVRDAADDAALDEEAWVFVRGRPLRRPETPASVQRAATALASTAGVTEMAVGQEVRLRAEPLRDGDGQRIGTLVVGVPLAPYEHTERIAQLGMLLLDCFVLAAGLLLTRWAVGRALQPVAEMTRRAADWSEHDLDRRFDLGLPRDELTALSATLDGLLARIAASLRHEQRFSAEMAHELRTPLSGVRGEAELALRAEQIPPDVREALEQIVRGTTRMEAVVETLLTVARGDAGAARGSSEAHAAAALAVEAVHPAGERNGVAVTLAPQAAEALRVGAEQEVVAQALHPLLDNAIRHARSSVTVSVQRVSSDVIFCVRDDGPGVEQSALVALFEPGRSSVGGAGLGLPLARRVARSCGGEVLAEPSAAAGGRFVLRLPALA